MKLLSFLSLFLLSLGSIISGNGVMGIIDTISQESVLVENQQDEVKRELLENEMNTNVNMDDTAAGYASEKIFNTSQEEVTEEDGNRILKKSKTTKAPKVAPTESPSSSSTETRLTESPTRILTSYEKKTEDMNKLLKDKHYAEILFNMTSADDIDQNMLGKGNFSTSQVTYTNDISFSEGNCDLVRVEILTDNYPAETSWQLTDTANNIILSGYNYQDSGTTYSDEVCVDDWTILSFTINDSYGDGICCSYTIGSYTVKVNDSIVLTGGEFTFTETKPLQPSPCLYGEEIINGESVCRCAPDEIRFLINLVTDRYPQETKWTVSTCDGVGILQGSYARKETEHIDSYCIAGGQAYTFEITDTYGDGICCGYGEGNYALFVDGIEFFSSEGEFGSSEVAKMNGDCTAPSSGPSIGTTSTSAPSFSSDMPSLSPSSPPTIKKSSLPSSSPSSLPSYEFSVSPSLTPSISPSLHESSLPSSSPSSLPSNEHSELPSLTPSSSPSLQESSLPSSSPSSLPSDINTDLPSMTPSISPSLQESSLPSSSPSSLLSNEISVNPSLTPSSSPSLQESSVPSSSPSSLPSDMNTDLPSLTPSISPSLQESSLPSSSPSSLPSNEISVNPSLTPSSSPSLQESSLPSSSPSSGLSAIPSMSSNKPSSSPFASPSLVPSFSSDKPSSTPSFGPSETQSITQIFVDQPGVEYGGAAEMINCLGTNTNMIRKVVGTGYVTFTVDLQCLDVEVEVSYVSAGNRNMHIFVNDGAEQTFVFSNTGVWCFQGGTSSTIMLSDLSGVKVGLNTFTFQNPSGTPSPLLEWIKFKESCSSSSESPSEAPSTIPSTKTMIPSNYPIELPSLLPSSNLSSNPSSSPSIKSLIPSTIPSDLPSDRPSLSTSHFPTTSPTDSLIPSMKPSKSQVPSEIPTLLPSNAPSLIPSSAPSESFAPSFSPTTELFGTTCIDDESYEFTLNNGNTADCTWFLHYNPLIAFRRKMYCDGNTLFRCKRSCGRCPTNQIPLDDEDYQFMVDGELKACSWFSDNSNSDMYNVLSRQKSYCQQSYNGVLIADKCKLSCYEAAVLPKKGLLINKNVAETGAGHFGGFVSWYTNYKQEPYEGTFHREFIDRHGIEYVPMFSQNWLDHPDGTKRCFYEDYDVNGYVLQRNEDFPVCTQQDAITILQESKARSSPNSIPMMYVMGWNEQYINPSTKMTPQHMAYYYGKYLQPAAKASGLKIVSPTLNVGSVAWFAEFLDHCYQAKDDVQNPCDIFSMEKFAIHTYDCRYDLWTNWYGGNGSRLVTNLVNELEVRLGNVENWENYVLARPLWITETSCLHERTSLSFNSDNSFEKPKANAKEQCERITGQSQSRHGDGSLVAMENISVIERYAWWTTWHTKMKPHFLTYKDGTITQVGEAYKRIGDSSVNCEYPGTKIFADDNAVVITSPATLLDCQVTNTKMVKQMKLGGSATFTVNVPVDGNYAINVSYISAEPRNLHVKVNKNAIDPNDVFAETFNFYSTGDNSWCEGGTGSTHVVPLELKKFKAGTNTITFGNDGDEDSPVIEWIALVPKQG